MNENEADTPQNRSTPTLRALDAAANRAREGLRVVEDYARFVLDDRHLTDLYRRLRHDLAAAVGQLPPECLLAARETQADVGTLLGTPAQRHRDDLAGLLRANCLRLEEALRSLEEFGKLVHADMAARCEQLRYRAYTLGRAIQTTRWSLERLAPARLCVLLDGRPSLAEFETLAQQVLQAGADVIQLRDKQLPDRQLADRGRLLRQLIRTSATLLIVNDRPDLAALVRADGVHLGQEDLPVKDARAIVGPEALIGVSTHSLDQARQAVLDGANYIGVGPVFSSRTKHFEQLPGLELLRAVAAEIRLPAFAIGGIQAGNLAEVAATGFRRVAVASAIADASDPAAAVRDLRATLAAQPAETKTPSEPSHE